jgi:hypothetical protein
MYPAEELTRLAANKVVLRHRIARHRVQCTVAGARLARPVDWLDRVIALWRGLHPAIKFGAAPLGLLAARLVLPRRGILGALVRWGPLAFTAATAVGAATNGVSIDRPAPAGRGRVRSVSL